MTSPFYDVAVIGGGIAGTCAALALARQGAHVALLEAGSFPRHKVCGEFFSGEARPVFSRLGLDEALAAAPLQTVRESHLIAPSGRRVRLQVPQGAFAVSRHSFDALLWEAAQKTGIVGHERTRIRAVRREGNYHVLSTGRESQEFRARAVILSVGRNPAAALLPNVQDAAPDTSLLGHAPKPRAAGQFVGLKAHFRGVNLPQGRVEMHGFAARDFLPHAPAARGGYCGLTRVEDGLTNVCLLVSAQILNKRSSALFFAQLLSASPSLRARLGNAERVTPWLATANVRFGLRQPTSDFGLVCGDAAGYIPPLAGDGMSMAARSGELAGTHVARQLSGDRDAAHTNRAYQASWDAEFGGRLRWAEALQTVGLHRHGAEIAVGALRTLPFLRSLAVRVTRG